MADKTQTNDDKIKTLLTAVDAKRANLGTRPKGERATNGLFKWREGQGQFNVHTVKDVTILVDAMAFLLEGKGLREQASEELGVDPAPFKWNGFTVEQWGVDFKLRIAVLTYEKNKRALAVAEKKLKTLMSEGTKTELELEGFAELLA